MQLHRVRACRARAMFLVATLAGCTAGAHGRSFDRRSTGPLFRRLGTGAPAARSLEARTSIATTYARCRLSDSLPVPARCAPQGSPDGPTLRLAARAAALARDSTTPDALHASALIDLVWSDAPGKSLLRSVQTLGQAARYEGSAAAWADLAAAELARADREDEPSARLAALDAAARAVSADSSDPIARFNLALAAERLGLDGRARDEWTRYLALDRTSAWAGEARERLAMIDRRAVPSAHVRLDSAAIASLAEDDPNALRVRVLGTELGAWSAAIRAHDSARVAAARSVIDSAGVVLARRYGDSTLLDVSREMSRRPLPAAFVDAADAFAAGQRAVQQGRYAEAEELFARGAGVHAAPVLAAWCGTYRAIQQAYTGKTDRAIDDLRSAMAEAERAHRSALEARAGWSLAVLLFRAGRRGEGNAVAARVASRSRLLGDQEGVAAVNELLAEDRYAAGDERAAWRRTIDAMSTLRRHRASLRLRNALNLLALAAEERGLSGAAAIVRDEDAAVALANGHPEFYAEAELAAARSRLLQGDTIRALSSLREVERNAAAIPASDVSRWLSARAAQLRVEAGMPVSRATIDSAVTFFGARRIGVSLVDALLTRAHALASTDVAGAEQDLDSALSLVRARASQYRTTAERRALDRRIRDIAARSALTYLAAHDTARALAALERGRLGEVPHFPGSAPAVLDYLLVGDTLVTWRIVGGHITAARARVPARAVAFAREQIARSAESGLMDRAAAITLYDALVRRHRAVLRGVEHLVVVADDALAGIPFAALYDSSGGGAYLVERTSVRIAARLADAFTPPAAGPVSRALFVGDPAFDRAANPGLAALPAARAEVDASRRFYRSAVVLAGRTATASAVRASMVRANLVHFASHAQFDAERPERSRLVLASSPDGPTALTAHDISRMALDNVRLAVLSACESTRNGVADAPVTVGLAKAFLDAGVPEVIGALWRVDDDATAALMAAFHQQYSATRDAARALRGAQLTLLRSAQPARRDPATWGAFVLSGR